MPLVLIPSDQRDWSANFADGYRRLGWDVVTGTHNFILEASRPDIVHFNWPEELTGWRVPDAAELDRTIARLERWGKRSRLIISVNNLYPHGQARDPVWHRLYKAFYDRVDVIHHFSQASRDLVCAEYPSARCRNHLVRLGFNYDLLLPAGPRDRCASRAALGLGRDDIVYLAFGALRFWQEVCVLRDGFGSARVPRKRLLVAARYEEAGTPLRRRLRCWRWEAWQRRNGVRRVRGYVPETEVSTLFDAADVVVVVRQANLNSGLPCLAMTFGRFVIAPSSGATPEYLAGTGNLLYEGTSAEALAAAMERAAGLDRERIGSQNRDVAASWDWKDIIRACLEALPERGINVRAERFL